MKLSLQCVSKVQEADDKTRASQRSSPASEDFGTRSPPNNVASAAMRSRSGPPLSCPGAQGPNKKTVLLFSRVSLLHAYEVVGLCDKSISNIAILAKYQISPYAKKCRVRYFWAVAGWPSSATSPRLFSCSDNVVCHSNMVAPIRTHPRRQRIAMAYLLNKVAMVE